jgi:hypothetical protein
LIALELMSGMEVEGGEGTWGSAKREAAEGRSCGERGAVESKSIDLVRFCRREGLGVVVEAATNEEGSLAETKDAVGLAVEGLTG